MSDTTAAIDPQRTALLVLDYQNATAGSIGESEALLKRMSEIIAFARDKNIVIAYVRMGFEDADYDAVAPHTMLAERLAQYGRALDADSPNTAIHADVSPHEGDIVVRKTRVGGFSTTDLDVQLRARGVDTLLVGGITTSAVVLSTMIDAFDKDYLTYVITDLTADHQPDIHEFLVNQIFPRFARVTTSSDLPALIAG